MILIAEKKPRRRRAQRVAKDSLLKGAGTFTRKNKNWAGHICHNAIRLLSQTPINEVQSYADSVPSHTDFATEWQTQIPELDKLLHKYHGKKPATCIKKIYGSPSLIPLMIVYYLIEMSELAKGSYCHYTHEAAKDFSFFLDNEITKLYSAL